MASKHVAPPARQFVRFTLFAGLLVSGLVAASHADALERPMRSASPGTPDAFRFCSDQIPDAGAARACMIAKKSELSSGCRAMFNQASASR